MSLAVRVIPCLDVAGVAQVEEVDALDHAPAVEAGADAVLAATVFHFGTLRVGEVKSALGAAGHPVR